MKRVPALDGLRGLAILSVLVWHYSNFYEPAAGSISASVLSLFKTTWSGVDLFFVLSGFLIGGILIDNRTAANLWETFYIRRALRILPLYFLVFFSFVFLVGLNVTLPWLLSDSMPLWSYATFTQNFSMAYDSRFGANFLGPTWSLAVEEQFYLVAPFIVRFTSQRLLVPVLLLLIFASVAARIAMYHYLSAGHYLSTYVLAPCRSDALLMGVLCATIVRSRIALEFIKRRIWGLRLATTCLLGVTIAFSARYGSLYSKQMIFGGYTLLAALYSAILLSAVVESKGPLIWLLTRQLLMKLGTIAFAVYLLHLIVLGLMFRLVLGTVPKIDTVADLGIVLVAAIATVIASQISWLAMERRLIRLGHQFSFTSPKTDRTLLQPSDILRA